VTPEITLDPGLIYLPSWLGADEQQTLTARCVELGRGRVGQFQPVVRGGAKMRLEMLCLGRHWNARTYTYESVRSDFDGEPVPPLPDDFRGLAQRAARDAGFDFEPDICIMNFYRGDGRLGLHQDKDERPETLAAGVPIVSISLGDSARFLVGGTRRKDPTRAILLRSGDAIVMGGPSRLRYHGVTRVYEGTGPNGLAWEGRINLTFRKY
jgi:DNA alkylation damage repair protein AlkB